MAERFRNGSESGCGEGSSGAFLCRGHGNCCGCGWRCDCGSGFGCHGFWSGIFRNSGCGDRLISHECKRSLPGGHKRTWHWRGDTPRRGGCRKTVAERATCASNMHLFLQYSPGHSKDNIVHDRASRSTYLVGAEFGVVQLSNSIGHVFFAHKFYNTGSVSENVGVADVPGLAHVVLQVLPAAALGKSCNTYMWTCLFSQQ